MCLPIELVKFTCRCIDIVWSSVTLFIFKLAFLVHCQYLYLTPWKHQLDPVIKHITLAIPCDRTIELSVNCIWMIQQAKLMNNIRDWFSVQTLQSRSYVYIFVYNRTPLWYHIGFYQTGLIWMRHERYHTYQEEATNVATNLTSIVWHLSLH